MKHHLKKLLRKTRDLATQAPASRDTQAVSEPPTPYWLNQTPPTIIFGNPRSGTRMCANVLNKHPQICVTEETLALPQQLAALDQIEGKFLGRYHKDAQLQNRRELMARALWIARSSDSVIKRMQTAKYIVNKTPRLEHRFDELEALFQLQPPRYVYCLRNAFGVLKSIKNLPNLKWYENPVDVNLEHYLASLRQYDRISAAIPDRIVMINIDEIKTAPSNFEFYQPVFDLMQMPPVPEKVQASINDMGPQNTMARVNQKTGNKADVQDLTEDEIALIADNAEYQAFAARFGLATAPR